MSTTRRAEAQAFHAPAANTQATITITPGADEKVVLKSLNANLVGTVPADNLVEVVVSATRVWAVGANPALSQSWDDGWTPAPKGVAVTLRFAAAPAAATASIAATYCLD